MKAVLDTNVLISAVIATGVPHEVGNKILNGVPRGHDDPG